MLARPTLHSPRRTAERRSQECAVAATSHLDRLPPDGDDFWKDLRRGRRRIWGGLLAFLERAHAIGTPFSIVLFGIETVLAFACDLYGAPPMSITPLPPVRGQRTTATGTTLRRAA